MFRTGRRVEGLYLNSSCARPASGGRIGFVIGRKVSPRAVDRNRIAPQAARSSCARCARRSARYDIVLRVKRGARNRAEQDAGRRARRARLLADARTGARA